ncbi:MAG TPA: hypothetical protein VLV81_05280 [Acidimicrobiia bacterium]|nr:hypothetical protein [Acidimicrobiia bacterium]
MTIVVVTVASWSTPAEAAPGAKFCVAVRTFNATRPSSQDEAVTALQKLAAASIPSVRAAVNLITQEADTVDAATALAQAAGNASQATPLTAAGLTITGAADQTCHLAVNFAGAVPTGVSKRRVNAAGWARTVCSSIAAWGHTVNDAGANLVTAANGQTTLSDLRVTLSQFLSKAVAATQTLNTQLGGAGVPIAPSGAAFAASIRLGVSRTLLTFVGEQPSVSALPDDASAFQTTAQALVTKLDTAGRSVQSLVQEAEIAFKAKALAAVFARQPGCAGIG